MGLSAAERQRRSRAHRRGDHSLCDRQRCEQGLSRPAEPDVTGDAVTPPAVRLRSRGLRLWRELTAEGEPPPLERVLIEEACRLADRLDRFDGIVNGRDRSWLTLELDDLGDGAEVVVDKVLAEARQQQVAFKQLLAELRQSRSATAGATGGVRRGAGGQPRTSGTGARSVAGVKGAGRGGVLADLTSRLAARRDDAAG